MKNKNSQICKTYDVMHAAKSDSVQPHRWQPTRLPHPWDSPGKNTGVGCHFLLQCMKVKMKVKLLSHVRLVATPLTAAYQTPPSMGFSRQEYWSGVPLPSPMWCMNTHESPCCHKLVSKLSFGNHWKDSFYLIIAQELLTNTSSDFIIFYIIFCLKTTRVSCPPTDSELFQTLAWCW